MKTVETSVPSMYEKTEDKNRLRLTSRGRSLSKLALGVLVATGSFWAGYEVADQQSPEVIDVIDHTAGNDSNGEIHNLGETLEEHGYDPASITNLTTEGIENNGAAGPQDIIVYDEGGDTYSIDVVDEDK